jgi:DNA-binding transcriptional LysR family regulator
MRNPENVLEFNGGEKVKVFPTLTLNDTGAMLACARSGMGIVQLHHYVVEDAVESGDLVEILNRYVKPNIPIFLYYPPRRYLQSKVRKFIEYYSEKIELF